MAKSITHGIVEFTSKPAIIGQAAVGGKIEREGPLGRFLAESF